MKRSNTFFSKQAGLNRPIRWLLKKGKQKLYGWQHHWQVSGNLNLHFEELSFTWHAKADDPVASSLYYEWPYHEIKDLKLFRKLARKARVILDIGAYTGIYSLIASLTNQQSQVFAFEPYPVNAERLRKNAAMNNLSGIHVQEQALGDENRMIGMSVPADMTISDTNSAVPGFSQSSYGGRKQWKSIQVQQTTVDIFARETRVSGIDLIKIDVEGYEANVLKGAIETIRSSKPAILCEILAEQRGNPFFFQFMQEMNYSMYMILAEGLVRVERPVPGNESGLNYLFLPGMLAAPFTPYTDPFFN